MKFSLTRPVKVVMLGCGGTGGHIAPHLYRLLYALDRPVKIVLCDGDIVEEKNLVRQNFCEADLGENKAKILAERYSNAFGMEVSYAPHFIETEKELTELLTPAQYRMGYYESSIVRELVLLIGAVDNNKSRRLCHTVFSQAEELVYIDSGNGEYTGQVVCGVRRGGRTLYKPVGSVYPELARVDDLFPSEQSCAEASVSAPQTIAANLMAATSVVNMIYNILVVGDSTVRQTTFSTKTVNLRPTVQKSRRKAA